MLHISPPRPNPMGQTFQKPAPDHRKVELGEPLWDPPTISIYSDGTVLSHHKGSFTKYGPKVQVSRRGTVQHTWTHCSIWLNPEWLLGSPHFFANKNANSLPSLFCLFPASINDHMLPRKELISHIPLLWNIPLFPSTDTPPHQYNYFNICRYPCTSKWWM